MRDSNELRELCIQNNWFTSGSSNQYAKLFDSYYNDSSIEDVSLIIWLCTPNTTQELIIKELVSNNISFCSKQDDSDELNTCKPYVLSALSSMQSVRLDVLEEDGSIEDLLDDLKNSIISNMKCFLKLLGK